MDSRLFFHLLSLALVSGTALAQNDECSGAIPLTIDTPVAFDTTSATQGTPFPCASTGAPDLWFSYQPSAAGQNINVELCGSTYDTALEIFDGTCGAPNSLICNDDACGLQSAAIVTSSPTNAPLLIRVGGFNQSTGAGQILVTEVGGSPCLQPDMFEDSDDCATALPLGDGTYAGLNVEELDNDYYQVVVANGATLDAEILFVDAIADCDLYLWDPLVACDTNVAGTGTGAGALALGFSASDNEQVVYTNQSGSDQTLILEVDMYTVGGCNEYTLIIDGAGTGSGPIGFEYCQANPNSTGSPATMSAFGSASAAANNVTLTADQLPMNVNGYFLTSLFQAFVPNPGGSAGNLCLGGTIGRYLGPGQMQNTGMSNSMSLSIDLTQTPLSMGFGTVLAGQDWNYQCWFRDKEPSGVGTSNFSSALSILFN